MSAQSILNVLVSKGKLHKDQAELIETEHIQTGQPIASILEAKKYVDPKDFAIAKAESLKFFMSRSRGSQMGIWLAQSSEVISSRNVMKGKLAELKHKFSGGEVPLPSAWGGYRVVPRRFEFWQGHTDHLHDRIAYTLVDETNWVKERLLP